MRMKKVYGQSQVTVCAFCGSTATTKTGQGVPCCRHHVKAELPNMKCVCKGYLDFRESKWGGYFSCMNCGNISFSKGLAMNELSQGTIPSGITPKLPQASKPEAPKEIFVTSDDADFIVDLYR